MSIEVQCPDCGFHREVDDQLAGRKAKCQCGNVFRIQGQSATSTAGEDASIRADPPAEDQLFTREALPTRVEPHTKVKTTSELDDLAAATVYAGQYAHAEVPNKALRTPRKRSILIVGSVGAASAVAVSLYLFFPSSNGTASSGSAAALHGLSNTELDSIRSQLTELKDRRDTLVVKEQHERDQIVAAQPWLKTVEPFMDQARSLRALLRSGVNYQGFRRARGDLVATSGAVAPLDYLPAKARPIGREIMGEVQGMVDDVNQIQRGWDTIMETIRLGGLVTQQDRDILIRDSMGRVAERIGRLDERFRELQEVEQ